MSYNKHSFFLDAQKRDREKNLVPRQNDILKMYPVNWLHIAYCLVFGLYPR